MGITKSKTYFNVKDENKGKKRKKIRQNNNDKSKYAVVI